MSTNASSQRKNLRTPPGMGLLQEPKHGGVIYNAGVEETGERQHVAPTSG
jgi:hypothetical protein